MNSEIEVNVNGEVITLTGVTEENRKELRALADEVRNAGTEEN